MTGDGGHYCRKGIDRCFFQIKLITYPANLFTLWMKRREIFADLLASASVVVDVGIGVAFDP